MKTLIYLLMIVWILLATATTRAGGSDSADESAGASPVWSYLKTGIAWGIVPFGSEVVLNGVDHYLKKNHYLFLSKFLKIHRKNISRSANQHLTDNLSAYLERVSYKLLSDDYKKKKVDDLQTDLFNRSLHTSSILSKYAQKARKTYFRLINITDTVSESALNSLQKNNADKSAALIALAAQLIVYIHPEMQPEDTFNSVYTHFSNGIDWSAYPQFRQRVTAHLGDMDPLFNHSSIMQLRYCQLLNVWQIDSSGCNGLEGQAVEEYAALLEAPSADGGVMKNILAGIPAGIPDSYIHNSLVVLGASIPAVFLYQVNDSSPAVKALVEYFAKITGLATSKEAIEKYTSQSRRALEHWGASHTDRQKDELGNYSNRYLKIMQANAGKLLAEQPNFVRSNAQRALEILVIHFSDLDSYSQEAVGQRQATLAGALVHNYREIVDAKVTDTLVSSVLKAYRPLNDVSVDALLAQIARQDSDYVGSPLIQKGYEVMIRDWLVLSQTTLPSDKAGTPELYDSPSITFAQKIGVSDSCLESDVAFHNEALSCPSYFCPASEQLSTSISTSTSTSTLTQTWSEWLSGYVPDKDMVSTVTMHSSSVGYSLVMSFLQPMIARRLMPDTRTTPLWVQFASLSAFYFATSVISFGSRSVGEPAIVHLQTVLKNMLSSGAGILQPEDVVIQDELSSKVDEINRKVGIDAQRARATKMPLEALVLKSWRYAYILYDHGLYSDSAASVAYSAYIMKRLHPEFEARDKLLRALADSRLVLMFQQLRDLGLMEAYSRHIWTQLAQLDEHLEDSVIQDGYVELLASWGIDTDPDAIHYAEDVLNSWAVYGDYLLGGIGFSVQSMMKALVHNQNLFIRTPVNFLADVFEFGTTDSLRMKVYACARQRMLNIIMLYEEYEDYAAVTANQRLTDSFRRQKFYFSKPDLDMRTQLVQMITSLIDSFTQAHILILDQQYDRASDVVALALVRMIVLAPDFAGDDVYFARAIRVMTHSFAHELQGLNQSITEKVSMLLEQEEGLGESHRQSGLNKVSLVQRCWMEG